MQRWITRLALGAKCSGLITPSDERLAGLAKPAGPSIEVNASEPTPSETLFKNERRFSRVTKCSGFMFQKSETGGGFIQVQNRAGHCRPCGNGIRLERLGHRPLTGGGGRLGLPGIRSKMPRTLLG